MSLIAISAAAMVFLAQGTATPDVQTGRPPVAEAEHGVTSYPAAYFLGASPSTSYDMVVRVPGFAFDRGAQVRGLAGSGGNVLIDGEPPVSKNDSLEEILRRIPTVSVARIDLIRGGAPGIDMQGRTVLVNVVRKSTTGFHGAVTAGSYSIYDGRTLNSLRGEGQWRWDGGKAAEYSFVVGFGPDDKLGDGRRVRRDASGRPTITSNVDADGKGLRIWNTGAYETPLAGGKLRVNAAYLLNPYSAETTDRLITPAGKEYQYDTQDRLQAELGARYTRSLTPRTALEAVVFQQWNNNDSKSRFESAALNRKFEGDRKTTETVGRATVRFAQSDALNLEVGVEGAFNHLDNMTTLFVNNARVRVPAGSVVVEEKRGEVFGTATWHPSAQVNLEFGIRQEKSTITASGDVTSEKSTSFTKPRVAMTWTPDPQNQFRLRVEREVGQLNFDDFVAPSSVVSTGTVLAGNPNLSPQQAWVAEATYERRFWKSGSVVAMLRHSELTDVIDRAPIFGAGGTVADAPGNIGKGTKDEVQLGLSLPLDRFGIRSGLLKAQSVWRKSQVTDPLTRKSREISNLRPNDWDLHFSQDLKRWKSIWGFDVNKGASGVNEGAAFQERAFRLSEVETFKVDPWVTVYIDYKPKPDLSLRLEVLNLTERSYERIREVYTGPRDRSPLSYTDVRDLRWGRVINVRLRKTF